MNRILLVEDEDVVRRGIEISLSDKFEVIPTGCGDTALVLAKRELPDLVILDILLPGLNGLDVLRELRRNGLDMPVIVLSALLTETERVVALELGADDYVCKPFGHRELLARIRACLRRVHRAESLTGYQFGDNYIDLKHRCVTRFGKAVQMTSKEFDLLCFLIRRRNEVVSRQELLKRIWDLDYNPSMRTVDTHVLTLRQKIEEDYSKPEFILSVHGEGYKFVNNSA